MAPDSNPSTESAGISRWVLAMTVMLPTLMEIIDTSVANVALPHMQGSFSAGSEEIMWVITSYLVSNAVVLPMTGWLARVFGRKRFLLACVILFTLASLLCGAAPNLTSLIFFRIMQGAAGGALVPISQAILMESFPPNERGMAMAIFGVGAMFGPIVGPALGGWITDNFAWRWIFYINVPLGILAVIMVSLNVFDPPYLECKKMSVDYWGLTFLVLAFGALQIILDKGQQEDWLNSNFIVGLSALCVCSLVALIFVELRHKDPVVNLRLFRDYSFAAGNLIMFCIGFCLYGAIILIPLFLQTLMGYTAAQAGMVLAPGGVATLLMMPVVGALLSKVDGRKVVLCGLVIGGCSMFIMQGFTLDASYWDFVWPRVVLGVGLAMIFVPLTTLTLASIPQREMGNATGVFSLLRNIGGSVGIAITATLLSRDVQTYHSVLGEKYSTYSSTFQQARVVARSAMQTRGFDAVSADLAAVKMLAGQLQRQSAMLSYNHVFWIVGVVFFAVAPLLLLLKRQNGHVIAGH